MGANESSVTRPGQGPSRDERTIAAAADAAAAMGARAGSILQQAAYDRYRRPGVSRGPNSEIVLADNRTPAGPPAATVRTSVSTKVSPAGSGRVSNAPPGTPAPSATVVRPPSWSRAATAPVPAPPPAVAVTAASRAPSQASDIGERGSRWHRSAAVDVVRIVAAGIVRTGSRASAREQAPPEANRKLASPAEEPETNMPVVGANDDSAAAALTTGQPSATADAVKTKGGLPLFPDADIAAALAEEIRTPPVSRAELKSQNAIPSLAPKTTPSEEAIARSPADSPAPVLDAVAPALGAAAPMSETAAPALEAATPVLEAAGPAPEAAAPALEATSEVAAPVLEPATPTLEAIALLDDETQPSAAPLEKSTAEDVSEPAATGPIASDAVLAEVDALAPPIHAVDPKASAEATPPESAEIAPVPTAAPGVAAEDADPSMEVLASPPAVREVVVEGPVDTAVLSPDASVHVLDASAVDEVVATTTHVPDDVVAVAVVPACELEAPAAQTVEEEPRDTPVAEVADVPFNDDSQLDVPAPADSPVLAVGTVDFLIDSGSETSSSSLPTPLSTHMHHPGVALFSAADAGDGAADEADDKSVLEASPLATDPLRLSSEAFRAAVDGSTAVLSALPEAPHVVSPLDLDADPYTRVLSALPALLTPDYSLESARPSLALQLEEAVTTEEQQAEQAPGRLGTYGLRRVQAHSPVGGVFAAAAMRMTPLEGMSPVETTGLARARVGGNADAEAVQAEADADANAAHTRGTTLVEDHSDEAEPARASDEKPVDAVREPRRTIKSPPPALPFTAAGQALAEGVYKLTHVATGKALDLSAGDGRSVIGWPAHGEENQLWRFACLGRGVTIQSVASGAYLVLEDGICAGAVVVASDYPVAWKAEHAGEDGVRISWPGRNLHVGLKDGAAALLDGGEDQANLQLWTMEHVAEQRAEVVAAAHNGHFPAGNTCVKTVVLRDGMLLDAVEHDNSRIEWKPRDEEMWEETTTTTTTTTTVTTVSTTRRLPRRT